MSLWTIAWRSLRLRCPACGRGRLFRNWFAMHESCSNCQASFQREAGFFLGSIYVNYGLTALVVSIAYPALLFGGVLSDTWLMGLSLAFVIVFPIAFFPFARSLWFGFDAFFDPSGKEGKSKK